jgi:hypothetical protein
MELGTRDSRDSMRDTACGNSQAVLLSLSPSREMKPFVA